MPSITENGITIIIVCILCFIILVAGCIIKNSNDPIPRPTIAFQAIFLDPFVLEQNANMYIREAEIHSQNDDLQIIVVNVQILGDDALSDGLTSERSQVGISSQSLHLPIAQPIDTMP